MSANFPEPKVKSGQGSPLSKLGYPQGWFFRPTYQLLSLPHHPHGGHNKSGPVKAYDKKMEPFCDLKVPLRVW